MSSWSNNYSKAKKVVIPPIPEWKFPVEIVNNPSNKTSILNSNLTGFDKTRFSSKYNFDIKYFKNFNDETISLDETQLYNFFIYYVIPNNKTYDDHDYVVNNIFQIEQNTIKDSAMVFDHKIIRNIKSYSELVVYRNSLKKRYIYNSDILSKCYYDLDLEFYRQTYLNNGIYGNFDIYLHYHRNKQNNRNSKQLIVVYSPPYDIKIGGVLAMHYLCKIINEKFGDKYSAKLFMHNDITYKNPFCDKFARLDEINNDTIVIYPEIIFGNPLNAKNVIRWILLDLGIEMPLNHYKNWNMTDYVYYWEPKRTKQLCCPFFNPIFKNNNMEKTKTCFLVKKGRHVHKHLNYIHPTDSIQIDNMSISEIAEVFNKSKYFYCYDPYSLFAMYATVCGCVTIVYPIENVTEHEYYKGLMYNYKNIIYNKGITYGHDQNKIEKALTEVSECEKFYTNLIELYECTVFEFLNDIPNIKSKTNLKNTVSNYFY